MRVPMSRMIMRVSMSIMVMRMSVSSTVLMLNFHFSLLLLHLNMVGNCLLGERLNYTVGSGWQNGRYRWLLLRLGCCGRSCQKLLVLLIDYWLDWWHGKRARWNWWVCWCERKLQRVLLSSSWWKNWWAAECWAKCWNCCCNCCHLRSKTWCCWWGLLMRQRRHNRWALMQWLRSITKWQNWWLIGEMNRRQIWWCSRMSNIRLRWLRKDVLRHDRYCINIQRSHIGEQRRILVHQWIIRNGRLWRSHFHLFITCGYTMQVSETDTTAETSLAAPSAVRRQQDLANIVQLEVVHIQTQLFILVRLDEREQVLRLGEQRIGADNIVRVGSEARESGRRVRLDV